MQLAEYIAMAPPPCNVPTSPEPASPKLTVRQVDPTVEPGWDALVLSFPGHTFFHSAAWARVMKEAYGFAPVYLVCRTGVPPVAFPNNLDRRDACPTSAERRSPTRRLGIMEPAGSETGAPGIAALLPMMECRSWLRGTRGVSLPFTDECCALKSPWVDASILVETALEHGRTRGWRFAEFRGDMVGRAGVPPASKSESGKQKTEITECKPGFAPTPERRAPARPASTPNPQFPFDAAGGWRDACPTSATHWGHSLDLSEGAEAAFARFDPAVRRAIRKAEKSGLQVEVSRDPAALREFYRLHCLTRGRHGVPPQPFSFFAAIQKHVIDAGHGFVVVGRVAPRAPSCASHPADSPRNPNPNPNLRPPAIAASVYFHFGNHAIYKFGASDLRYQDLRANNLVMWTAIQHLGNWGRRQLCRGEGSQLAGRDAGAPNEGEDRGISRLDLGRTDVSNEGLRAFKLGWGTTETRLPYFRYDFGSKTYVVEAGTSRFAGGLGWGLSRACRGMPGPVARLAGAVLYPHWE